MGKLLSSITFLLVFNTVFSTAFGQGSWQPAGAINSFPRTLLKPSEIGAVQQSLMAPERFELYSSVYGWALSTPPPASSTTDTDRRLRARAAKNAAFIRIIDRKPVGNSLEMLSATEKTQLETNVISILETLNSSVDANYNYEKWQWRSKELIDYLSAYDMLRGAGVPATSLQTSKNKLQEFAGKLYAGASQSGFPYGIILNNIKNNHLLMTAAALGMAGVVLNDASSATTANQPTAWINAGMYAIDNVMWRDAKRQSEPGLISGYAEGPYYFKYAMENCLPFFRAMGNFLPDGSYSFTWNNVTRQIRNPYYDPNYDLLYQWMTEITMPDGRFPALEDSYIDMGMPELAITGKPQYVSAFNGQKMEPNQLKTLNAQLDGTVDLRANYLAANVTVGAPAPKPLTSLPTAGNLIFRSDNAFTGNYLHVYGKNGNMLTNSGGHNHGDASSFILYAKGQLLALDAGYLKYDRRSEVGNATNHNLVLVDGAGPVIGSAGSANDAQAYIQNTFETPNLMYGEMQTTYNGSNFTRKTISIRGEYYVMADFITAAANHNFTWQLHGFGLENGTTTQGTFTDKASTHEGVWQKNGVSLKAHVTATGGASSYTKTTSIHETTWNAPENHTTFLVKKDNVSQTQFLATLTPFLTDGTTTTTLNLPNMAGVITTSAAYTDLAFTKADTLLKAVTTPALLQSVSSDANLTFYSVDANQELNQAFLQNGTTLLSGTQELIKSNRRANLVWQHLAPGQFQGYVNKPATLLVKVANRPISVSGANLSSWTYNATTGILTATFTQQSDFQYKVQAAALPVEMVGFSAKKVNKHVVLNWQTASEKNNAAFDIQHTTDGKNWKTIGTKAGQGTTNALTSYEFVHTPKFSGPQYYRLAQRDLDGTVTFSAVKTVWLDKNEASGKIYPNPATQNFWLETENLATDKAELVLYNPTGTVVYKQPLVLQPGNQKIRISVPEKLPQGLYLVQLQTAEQVQTYRVQVNR